MSEKDWERFFELLDKIVALPGTWQEKKQMVVDRAEGESSSFEEFTGWFADGE